MCSALPRYPMLGLPWNICKVRVRVHNLDISLGQSLLIYKEHPSGAMVFNEYLFDCLKNCSYAYLTDPWGYCATPIIGKKHLITNVVSSAVLWSLWKFQNELCFQGRVWMGMKGILFKIAKMLKRWVPMMQQEDGEVIERVVVKLELQASSLPHLMWNNMESSSSRSDPLDAQPLGFNAANQSEAAGLSAYQGDISW